MLVQERTDEEKAKSEGRLLQRQEKKQKKLQDLGIDYDFGDAAYVSCPFKTSLSCRNSSLEQKKSASAVSAAA
jgi:hypothetical protein